MKKLLQLTILILWSSTAYAQTFFSDSGKATFYSKVPLHSFEGNSENLTGMINLDENIVDFYLDLETLKTGNGKRDKDMRITLKTDEFPFAEFYGTLISEFDPELDTEQQVIVNGDFTIHGRTQSIEVEGTLQSVEDGILLKAGWILNMDDYEIEPPSLLIMKVDEEQEIELEMLLTVYEGDS